VGSSPIGLVTALSAADANKAFFIQKGYIQRKIRDKDRKYIQNSKKILNNHNIFVTLS